MANDSDIHTTRLKSYLSGELDTEVVETEVINNGVNLVVFLSTERRQNAYVLRRPNRFKQSNFFSGIIEEYGILQRLEETSIPAPRPVLFCEDSSVIGGSFYVRTHLDGIPLPWGEELPEQYQNAAARQMIANRMIETLAQIHSLDSTPFEDVCETVPPVKRVHRGIARLDEATKVTGRDPPLLRDVADWLLANAPADTTTALVHGDYKPDNVLLTEPGPPEIDGVIDWETATLGEPLTDLGLFLLFWRDSDDPTPSVAELENAYPDREVLDFLEQVNEDGFWPFTNDPGSPTRREIVAHYEQRANTSFENEQFYRALAAFTVATFWEFAHGQIAAAADDAPETVQTTFEALADYMTSIADSIVDGRFEL